MLSEGKLEELEKVAKAAEPLDEEYDESTPDELAAVELFGATFTPPAVLALIARTKAAEAELAALRAQAPAPVEHIGELLRDAQTCCDKITMARRKVGPIATQAQTAAHCISQARQLLAAASPAPVGGEVVEAIAAERRRQIEAEGWTPEHDDEHGRGEMARAAACYAQPADRREHRPEPHHYAHHGRAQAGDNEWYPAGDMIHVPRDWPWEGRWWKPDHQDRRRDLIRAAALIVAEIERLDRAALSPDPTEGGEDE